MEMTCTLHKGTNDPFRNERRVALQYITSDQEAECRGRGFTDNMEHLVEQTLGQIRRRTLTVDATVRPVCAPALLLCLVDLDV